MQHGAVPGERAGGFARRLRLPVVCAPMYRVTTPAMVIAALRAGVVGAIPRANAPDFDTFDQWLAQIQQAAAGLDSAPPYAVNLSTRMAPQDLDRHLALCVRRGVEIIISATGDPTELVRRALAHGLLVYCDAINLRFARKAIAAGATGVIAIGTGGGGHSGTVNHLTLVAAIRREFSGTIVMAGAISNGAAIRAAEVLGADLAYMGTRFIATTESGAAADYKQMLIDSGLEDLLYTDGINGVAANWLKPSLRNRGLDPDRLPVRESGQRGYGHLPDDVDPWGNIWSAGQGIEQVKDVPSTAELIERLIDEYLQAASVPAFDSSQA